MVQEENDSCKETFTIAEKKFHKQIADVPIFDCITCEQTLFRKDVIPIKEKYQQRELHQRKRKKSTEMRTNLHSNIYICRSCKKALKNDVDAKFTVEKKFKRNKPIRIVKELNELEERLIALRLSFLQIRELGQRFKKPQLGLTGGVINVPTDVSRIQHALPRDINETSTIAIAIKKSLRFKNAYAIGRIRPHRVIKALRRLCRTTLYKLENIKITERWEKIFNENKEAYESQTDLENEEFNGDNIDEDILERNEDVVTKTLLHGFTDTYNIFDLQNNQINIAPGEVYLPLGIFQDKYSEEMSFPTLFFGEKRPEDMTNNLSYQKIAKWEVLHKEHDFAYHTTNLF